VTTSAGSQTDFETRRGQLVARYLKPEVQRPPTSARGVHHMVFVCSDVEQTIRFYQDLLGFPLVELVENRDYKGSAHFFFDIGNGNLLAFFDFPGLGLGQAQEAIGGAHHIAISVIPERLDEIKKRLDERGIDYFGPDRGSASLYFRDPDGVLLELCRDPLGEMNGAPIGR